MLSDSPIYWQQRREEAIRQLLEATRELDGSATEQALDRTLSEFAAQNLSTLPIGFVPR